MVQVSSGWSKMLAQVPLDPVHMPFGLAIYHHGWTKRPPIALVFAPSAANSLLHFFTITHQRGTWMTQGTPVVGPYLSLVNPNALEVPLRLALVVPECLPLLCFVFAQMSHQRGNWTAQIIMAGQIFNLGGPNSTFECPSGLLVIIHALLFTPSPLYFPTSFCPNLT